MQASHNLGFLCPTTRRGIDAGFDADNQSRSCLADEPVVMFCPHCGVNHELRMYRSFGRLNEYPEED